MLSPIDRPDYLTVVSGDLLLVYDILTSPKRWIKRAVARDEAGGLSTVKDGSCFCLTGMILYVAYYSEARYAVRKQNRGLLMSNVREPNMHDELLTSICEIYPLSYVGNLSVWNDDRKVMHKDVVRVVCHTIDRLTNKLTAYEKMKMAA